MKKLATVILVLLLTLPLVASALADDEVFARVGGNTFSFLSGVGGWSTEIEMAGDGSFTGYYHDWELGDIGDGYPNGSLYECYFSGKFAMTRKIDPYTYELRLAALRLDGDPGVERIVDGVRVESATAYGVEGGDVFMLYCPGRPTADLPEEFLEWIRMPNAWEEAPGALPFYGLYNTNECAGFFSWAEAGEETSNGYDELSGAWRTAEDDGTFITLLLYPDNAFRLHVYLADEGETFMLEGLRAMDGDVIVVSDIRLGKLDAEGRYTQTGEMDTARFRFTLDLGSAPTLTLVNEDGDRITLYPFDMDSPD